jgi:hypothetical protein
MVQNFEIMSYELGKSVVNFQNLTILNQNVHKDNTLMSGVYASSKHLLNCVYIKLIEKVEKNVKQHAFLFHLPDAY